MSHTGTEAPASTMTYVSLNSVLERQKVGQMATSDFHFRSQWRVLGSVDEVFRLVSSSEALASWWPAAFLDVLEVEPGGTDGLGKVVRLETRGWLPYTLHWHLRVDERDPPRGFGFRVWGDLEGRGAWSFRSDGAWTIVGFDWRVRVGKPIVRWFSWLLRPLFASNYRWAMGRGERSLRLALARSHATDAAQRLALPPPPGPASFPPAAFMASVLVAVLPLLIRRSK